MSDAENNRMAIQDIRSRLLFGRINYEQAKEEARPIVARINDKGQQIAKKYGRRFHPIRFEGLMR